jgi:hypothetical protein
MKKIVIAAFLATFVLAGCQPTLTAEFADKAVVQAYLYADHAPEVKISKLIPFRDDVTFSDEHIDRLILTITDDTTGESFTLEAHGEGLYSSDAMRVTTGHTYSLSMSYNGEAVTATTEIPQKPENMTQSRTDISAGFGGFPGGDGANSIEIAWDNSEGDYYMLVVENIETDPEPIFEFDEDEDWSLPSFRVEPTAGSEATLSGMSFSYYGRHNVILIHMRPEYVLLYSSAGETSSTLTEIHANVEGGYGIFTGANCDTLQVSVVRSSSR